ncbi:DUF932 domain-containing protein [Nocardiopsis synnemataformans]|uniref:DUF932 domain-containing protein n=1 Tax=Nocardiopsis synnemataformans TaxID=61305 RepID=UPI003EBC531F
MTAIDVNAAFTTERADQLRKAADTQASVARRVAAGELSNLGNGRYRVNSGWDAGEILHLTQTGELLALHGLDETTGQAALYTREPAWHGLGAVVPEGVSDIDEVLALARIDFDVKLTPATYTWEGQTRQIPDRFTTVRDDTGAPLGVVGSKYVPLQNREAFTFLEDLTATYGVLWESAGALRDGKKVFVSMRLPESIRIDAGGVNDEIVPFIAVVNGHDGNSPFRVITTPWRPVCSNTERFAVRDAHTSWTVRHTASARERLDEARRTLGLTLNYYGEWAEEETRLAHTEMALREFHAVVDDLWTPPGDDASVRARNAADKRRDELTARFHMESDRVGRTAYAAERAITGWLDWDRPVRPGGAFAGDAYAARATSFLEGSADETKSRAHKRLMLVRR